MVQLPGMYPHVEPRSIIVEYYGDVMSHIISTSQGQDCELLSVQDHQVLSGIRTCPIHTGVMGLAEYQ